MGLEGLRKQATGEPTSKEEEEDLSNPWKVLAKTAGWASSNSWKPVAYVNNDETDTQVCDWELLRAAELREVCALELERPEEASVVGLPGACLS